MESPDFTIDQEDLKVLFTHTRSAYPNYLFNAWVAEVKESYINYRKRNLDNLEKYGAPKTFSKWINGQIVSLTS